MEVYDLACPWGCDGYMCIYVLACVRLSYLYSEFLIFPFFYFLGVILQFSFLKVVILDPVLRLRCVDASCYPELPPRVSPPRAAPTRTPH